METIASKILSLKSIDNNVIASFQHTNKLSVSNSAEVEGELMRLIKDKVKSIVLDFTGIKFVDSSGFQALLSVHIDAKLHDIMFVLTNLSDEAYELFNLVELDDVFELRNGLDTDKRLKKAS